MVLSGLTMIAPCLSINHFCASNTFIQLHYQVSAQQGRAGDTLGHAGLYQYT